MSGQSDEKRPTKSLVSELSVGDRLPRDRRKFDSIASQLWLVAKQNLKIKYFTRLLL